MAFLVGDVEPVLQRLAVPAVCALIAFEAYTPQWLFANSPDLAPGPLTSAESYTFNTLLLCLWYTYYKACTVDPGRYVFPPDYKKKQKEEKAIESDEEEGQLRRWCKKCSAPKPPRAHHCRTCRRCIPKMDHHCPWTSNCVSLQTFPHFLRFLVYTNLSLWTLLYFLSQRFLALWDSRHLPAYLGPTLSQLALLTVLTFAAGVTSLVLGILLATTLKGWIFNTTMIENWEIERHEAALERRYASSSSSDDGSWWASGERAPGGDTSAPHLSIEPVEFPYDIGIFANMAAAMGTRNPLLWFLPFAGVGTGTGTGTGKKTTGWEYEENGLNDREGLWPPADPDKVRHARLWRQRKREADRALEQARRERSLNPEGEREAFRWRQEHDFLSRGLGQSRILGELEELPPEYYDDYESGKSGWVNADGEHLGDYGVDEDAEFDEPPVEQHMHQEEFTQGVEDEDVPLAELIRRRKVRTKDGEDT
ncbi:hypothetical protein M434DRAFT_66326 [Hypoxylon sp. CO27-5]|nr:hypothetical protein M434DRAFT_66326 [Hypoxylon sp. CO27-5]